MRSNYIVLAFLFVLLGCNDNYTPKPKAFVKFDFPKKEYVSFDADCSFNFEYPVYANLIQKKENNCFFNLDFPNQNGVLYISYFPLNDNLEEHTEQSNYLAYKHNVIADGISERVYRNDALKVYGMLYEYEGGAATSAQFYLTDSVNHFFRGALYFNTEINDSILPINLFLKQDVKRLVETFHWIDK